jgi:hypothetical protein
MICCAAPNKGQGRKIMKIYMAVIGACAATLALSQVDVARAQSVSINTSRSNLIGKGSALQDVSTTRGRVLPKDQKGKASPISDQASGGVLTKNKKN